MLGWWKAKGGLTTFCRQHVVSPPFAFHHMQFDLYLWPHCRNFRVLQEIAAEEHEVDVRFKSGSIEIWPFRACAMHPTIIIGTVQSLWP